MSKPEPFRNFHIGAGPGRSVNILALRNADIAGVCTVIVGNYPTMEAAKMILGSLQVMAGEWKEPVE